MITRRQFAAAAPGLLSGAVAMSGCSTSAESESYAEITKRIWRVDGLNHIESAAGAQALSEELVRCATLAPSSHNTQCWKFAVSDKAITILPDLSRRCPAVDPDNHHIFVSLGCAAENLVQAALAHGRHAEVDFDAAHDAVRITLTPTPTQAESSPLFNAIAARQCTRGDYDGKPLSNQELELLARTGTSTRVRLLMLTERPAMERVLEYVVQGNTAQLSDPAFVEELESWIRFNTAAALRTRDGLYSVSSGLTTVPTWLGELAFGWFLTPKGENDKYARQIRSSAGIAVFIGQTADKSHWVEVGRCYERFALQATALGIRNAFLNQPVEVSSVRPAFAAALGLTGQRPDLVVRFGRGPELPPSLRRPVQDVLV